MGDAVERNATRQHLQPGAAISFMSADLGLEFFSGFWQVSEGNRLEFVVNPMRSMS